MQRSDASKEEAELKSSKMQTCRNGAWQGFKSVNREYLQTLCWTVLDGAEDRREELSTACREQTELPIPLGSGM